MSEPGIFEAFAVSLAALGGALSTVVSSATGTPAEQRSAYVIARANISIAEAMAKFALTQPAEKAAKIADAVGHLVTDSRDKLSQAVTDVEQQIKDAYQSAIDLGVKAAKGVGGAIDTEVRAVFWTFELQVLTALAALGAYLYFTRPKVSARQVAA